MMLWRIGAHLLKSSGSRPAGKSHRSGIRNLTPDLVGSWNFYHLGEVAKGSEYVANCLRRSFQFP